MHIRNYDWSDVSSVADIYCTAFYHGIRYPYRVQYPLAFRALAVQKQRLRLTKPSAYGFVCVADAEDIATLRRSNGEPIEIGTVLGYAWWERKTPSPAEDPWTKARHASFSYKLERALQRLEGLYETHVNPNLAESRRNIEEIFEVRARQQPFAKLREIPHWYLSTLAVHPDFQGNAVGRNLLSWGMERSTHDYSADKHAHAISRQPIITLLATPEGKRLYDKLGFKVLGEPNEETSALGTFGIPEYAMVWDPQNAWTESVDGCTSGQGSQLRGCVRWKTLTDEVAQPNAMDNGCMSHL